MTGLETRFTTLTSLSGLFHWPPYRSSQLPLWAAIRRRSGWRRPRCVLLVFCQSTNLRLVIERIVAVSRWVSPRACV